MKYIVLSLFLIFYLPSNSQKFDTIHKVRITGIDSIENYYLFHFKDHRKILSTIRMEKTDHRVPHFKLSIRKRKKQNIKLVQIHKFKDKDGLTLMSNRAVIEPIYFLKGEFKMPFIDAPELFEYNNARFVYGVE